MKIDQLIKLLDMFTDDLKREMYRRNINEDQRLQFIDLLKNTLKFLKDHEYYLLGLIEKTENIKTLNRLQICERVDYIRSLLMLNSKYSEIAQRKFLQEASDKLREAGMSFENGDYTSVINSLNSSIELALKDELDIPRTITRINTRKIIDICISSELGPMDYLKEVIKHVLNIDNKIKHQGYIPSKVDCINAITAVEDFIRKTKKYPLEMNKEMKEKIFSGI